MFVKGQTEAPRVSEDMVGADIDDGPVPGATAWITGLDPRPAQCGWRLIAVIS
jgi:hypothetical protein